MELLRGSVRGELLLHALGTIEDLHDVVAMYRAGQIVPAVERYSLDEALEAYRKLRDGELSARAVVVPHG